MQPTGRPRSNAAKKPAATLTNTNVTTSERAKPESEHNQTPTPNATTSASETAAVSSQERRRKNAIMTGDTSKLPPELARARARTGRLRALAVKLAKEESRNWREAVAWANSASDLPMDDGDEKMLSYIFETAHSDHLPKAKKPETRTIALREIIDTAGRGEQILMNILNDRYERPEKTGDLKRDIRAVMWAVYKRAAMKDQPFIGGMIVLEDRGKLAEFLKKSEKSGIKSYLRPSSHFQGRRNESLGMDFHDDNLRLPLQKRTLHFGTLAESNATFLKFEYYGFDTRGDQVSHTFEFIDVVLLNRKEVGYREDPSPQTITKLEKLIKENGLRKTVKEDKRVSHPENFTLEKAGTFYVRVLIEQQITDSTKKELALKDLEGSTPLDNKHLRQGNEVIIGSDELHQWENDIMSAKPRTTAHDTAPTTITPAQTPRSAMLRNRLGVRDPTTTTGTPATNAVITQTRTPGDSLPQRTDTTTSTTTTTTTSTATTHLNITQGLGAPRAKPPDTELVELVEL